MRNKVKTRPRTVYLEPEIWAYVDELCSISERKHSQEISQMIKMMKKYRAASDDEAFRLVAAHTPPKD